MDSQGETKARFSLSMRSFAGSKPTIRLLSSAPLFGEKPMSSASVTRSHQKTERGHQRNCTKRSATPNRSSSRCRPDLRKRWMN